MCLIITEIHTHTRRKGVGHFLAPHSVSFIVAIVTEKVGDLLRADLCMSRDKLGFCPFTSIQSYHLVDVRGTAAAGNPTLALPRYRVNTMCVCVALISFIDQVLLLRTFLLH